MVSTEEKEILKSISAYIEKERREAGVPGLAVAIVRDGRRIWSEGFGHCELTQEKEVTPQTLFAIGSSTKAFTATAVAMLVEEGKLDWDTPVNRYLPGFRLKDSLAGERLTLRDMACHRSGLPRYDLSLFNPELNRKDLVDCLQHLEANHDFRTVWQYQNLMYATLGYIVGEITGTSWEDFVAERILDPLGMKQSNFSLAESQREAEYAFPSARKDGEIIELPWIEITATGPAGSINSTIEDMTNWLVLNLKQGKFGDEQLLAAESVKQLHTPHMLLPREKHPEIAFRSYGLGWFIESYRGKRLIHHGGNTVGFTCAVSFMPDEDIGVVVLSNMSQDWLPDAVSYRVYDEFQGLEPVNWSERFTRDAQAARDSMAKKTEQIRLSAVPDTAPSHELEAYTGRYRHPGLGTLTISVEDGKLKGRYGLMNIDLHHHHYDIFAAELDLWFDSYTVLASFSTDKHDGRISSFAMPFGFETGLKETVFTRIPEVDTVAPDVLEKYAGEYDLKIAGVTVTVLLRDEKLVVMVPGQPAMEMFPVSQTKFETESMPGFSLEFKMEGDSVSEMIITQPGGVFTAEPEHHEA